MLASWFIFGLATGSVCGGWPLLSIRCGVQGFGHFSSLGHFVTPPPVGSDESVYVLDTADMGHAEADGANEWEDDHNARLYNAPGS